MSRVHRNPKCLEQFGDLTFKTKLSSNEAMVCLLFTTIYKISPLN